MLAYVIDPFRQCIEQVDFGGELEHIYNLIEARDFQPVYGAVGKHRVVACVDEYGLMRERKAFFLFCNQVLTGKTLVVSQEGAELAAAKVPLEDLRCAVSWVSERFAQAAMSLGLQAAIARAVSLGMRVEKTEFGYVAKPFDGKLS